MMLKIFDVQGISVLQRVNDKHFNQRMIKVIKNV